MMTQSEAEKQITKILAQLERDQGAVIDSIRISISEAGSTLCRTLQRKKVAISLSYPPHVSWDAE
jgi:hypothetical protein